MVTQLSKQVKYAFSILFALLMLTGGMGVPSSPVQAAQIEDEPALLHFTSGGRIQSQADSPTNPNWQAVTFALGNYRPRLAPTIDSRLTWNTFLGGPEGKDICSGLAVDGNGNIYVSGRSNASWGNPVRAYTGGWDAFVAKLDPSGVLVWNTFLGASSLDFSYGIATDSHGNTYITGYSLDSWGNPVRAYTGGGDAFVAKLNASGALVWNTFLGSGGFQDVGVGAFVDGNDNIYVTGWSGAAWGSPVRDHTAGTTDAFAAKLNPSGGLVWNTFLGGNGEENAHNIVADNVGNIILVGYSDANWGIPVQAKTGDGVAFLVVKLNPNGGLIWNTFLGEIGDPDPSAYFPDIAVAGNENIYVTGISDASWGSPLRAYSSGLDAFAARLDSTGHLIWNTFLGGSGDEIPFSIASDNSGLLYVAGESSATWGTPLLPAHPGERDAFAAKLDSDGSLILNLFMGGNGGDYAYGIAADNVGNIILAGYSDDDWGNPVQGNSGNGESFAAKVNLTPAFADVPDTYWAFAWIERLYNAGITNGCGNLPLVYCPEQSVSRAQMAVFLERGIHGSTYQPPAVGGGTGFADVPVSHWAAAWIKQLAADGVTTGCGGGNYCPEDPVTRAQMAIFLLRARYGAGYTPPGVEGGIGFYDVPVSHWAAAWIKQLAAEGITTGCGSGNYCPEDPVTRGQMAVFLVRTFNLP